MRLAFALSLFLVLISVDAHAQGASGRRGKAPGDTVSAPPFSALQAQIEVLRAEVEALAGRDSGLRVFDGEGNEVGQLAGLDWDSSGAVSETFFHVFFEALGVRAIYNSGGALRPLDVRRLAFADEECRTPVGYWGAAGGVAGFLPFPIGAFSIGVTGTVAGPMDVRSEIVAVDSRGGFICRRYDPPIVRPAVSLELHAQDAIEIAPSVPPFLFVGRAR